MLYSQWVDFLVRHAAEPRPAFQRQGQWLFNSFTAEYPNTAEEVLNADRSPFYRDDLIPAFLSYVLMNHVSMDDPSKVLAKEPEVEEAKPCPIPPALGPAWLNTPTESPLLPTLKGMQPDIWNMDKSDIYNARDAIKLGLTYIKALNPSFPSWNDKLCEDIRQMEAAHKNLNPLN